MTTTTSSCSLWRILIWRLARIRALAANNTSNTCNICLVGIFCPAVLNSTDGGGRIRSEKGQESDGDTPDTP